MKISVKR